MCENTGETLLNVFKTFNIELGNLNPAVIHGWFDTDCPDMKNLLNWLCSSLSKANYVPAQQLQEYSELEYSLEGEAYKEALDNLEKEYPNILDLDSNKLEVQLLEQEITLLEEEERKANRLIQMQEALGKTLSVQLFHVDSELHESLINCKKAEEDCLEKARKLDQLNELQYQKVVKYNEQLCDFEFSSKFNFLSNVNVQEKLDKFDFLANSVRVTLQQFADEEINIITRNIKYNDEDIGDLFEAMYKRLYTAREDYLKHKVDEEKLIGSLNYLNNCKLSNIPICASGQRQPKSSQIASIIQNICTTLTENCLNEYKLQCAENELKIKELNKEKLEAINNVTQKLLLHYYVVLILFKEEKSSIDSSDDFLRRIYAYISENVVNSFKRSNNMSAAIEEFKQFMATSKDTQKFKFAKYLIDLIRSDSENDCSFEECFKIISTFKDELKHMEMQTLVDPLIKCKSTILSNVNTFKKFLISGPTNRIIFVPTILEQRLRDMKSLLDNQNFAMKSALIQMKKEPLNKWEQIRSYLWVYYLTDPDKLLSVIKEIEQEKKECIYKND